MKHYRVLYLKCDALSLAGAFEKFRNSSLRIYEFCPSNYLIAPALRWDPMLNIIKVELELTSDADMYLFLEKGMTDRIPFICKRYSKTSSRYWKLYDPKQDSKHIICLDVNILCGYRMSKFIPTGGFKWIEPKEFE